MLSISSVSKRYGEHLAVDQLSMEIGSGSIIGLLGPNGAGKTTNISMISGLIKPDTGDVSILDNAPHQKEALLRI